MKKINFLMLILSALLFFGCRQESLYIDQESQNTSVSRNYVINDTEIKKDSQLWLKLSGIQTGLFGTDPKAKNNDPLLDGAVIMTEHAGVVERNGTTTYTFQIKRIYPSQDTENLVVRKNADGSYSGLLIQYHLSKQEIQAFQNAQKPEDIKGKISVYKINDLSLNSKNGGYTYTEWIGCLAVTYQVIPCVSSDHHTNPSQCELTGASAPQIIVMSVDDTHCTSSGNPGGSNPGSGPGGNPGSGTGGSSMTTPPELLYNTFLFNDYGDASNVCEAGNSQCEEARQLNIQLQAYLLSLSPQTSMLSSYLYTFLTIKSYFRLNGGTSFLTERFNLMAAWYNNPANSGMHYTEKDKFVNWGLNFLLQNPDVSWMQFENWFLTKSEGSDGVYDEASELAFAQQTFQQHPLPAMAQYELAFPSKPNALYPDYYRDALPNYVVYNDYVGGRLKQLFNQNGGATNTQNPFYNACAARQSYAHNKLGIMIPFQHNDLKGDNDWNYIMTASKMGIFLEKTYGPPTHKLLGADANDPNKIAKFLEGKTGIYLVINNDPTKTDGAGYTGHTDMIKNGYISGGANVTYPNGDIIKGGIKHIYIWELN